MSSRVRELLEEFATKLENVLKEDMRAAIDDIDLGLDPAPTNRDRPTGNSARKRAHGRGAKRDPGALEKLAARFHAHVKANPGLRIEQLNAQLGTTTKELQLPIRKLIASKQLKARGSKRSTTYSAAGGSAAKATGKKRRTKK